MVGGVGVQIVKQIRRGGKNEQEKKKTEKGKMRRQRRKMQYKTAQTDDGRGLHSRPGASIVLPGSLIR